MYATIVAPHGTDPEALTRYAALMTTFPQGLLAIDRERLDLRAGLIGVVVLAVFGVAVVRRSET